MIRKTFDEYMGRYSCDYFTIGNMKQVWDYQEIMIDLQEQEIEELKEKLNQALEYIEDHDLSSSFTEWCNCNE
jgi:hypothetical protein